MVRVTLQAPGWGQPGSRASRNRTTISAEAVSVEVVHGLEVCVLAFARIRSCIGKELECPGVRPNSERACTSASTSQVRVEVCARTPREARLSWWELQPGLAVGIAYLPALWSRGRFSALGLGALQCLRESGDSGTGAQLRQAVSLR